MTKTRWALFCGAAVLSLMTTFLLGGTRGEQAQPPRIVEPAQVHRYQLASFVLQAGTPGAYILDTHTGEVFQVVGKNPPEMVGSVAKLQVNR